MSDKPEMARAGVHAWFDAVDKIRAERREDGRVAVSNWPKPRVSNPSFLSDEAADFTAT